MSSKKYVPESDLKFPEDHQVNIERARPGSASNPNIRRILLGGCALAIGLAMTMTASPASAQYQWLFPSYQRPHKIKHKVVRRRVEQKVATRLPFGDIPKGPLEIFVSIEQQKLHFYSDGQLVATEPVATGVPGHLTPLGVFSVIERDRYHHSNLYSNAPMPFMERITWSGVALHEGPGVGRQASHGCIRMPGDFAARLFMLPTMGMRVIIARQELSPIPFADPHLFVRKDMPPTAALKRGVETAQQVAPGTKSDAEPAAAVAAKPAPAAADPGQSVQSDLRLDPAPADTPAAKDAAAPTAPAQPAPAQPSQTAQTPPMASPAGPAGSAPAGPAKSPAADAKTEPASSPPAPAAAAAAPQTAPGAPTTAAAPSASPASAAPVPGAVATAPPPTDMTAPIAIENVPIPLTKPARIEEGSDKPIAIFVSRKTGKIYVRQNFTPLFDAPVQIDDPQKPLGTHVYTAMDYMPDHSTFRWTETTLPTSAAPRKVERWKYVRDEWGRRRRVRVVEQVAAPEDSQPVSAPAEALARIHIPQDVIDQISRLMVPGSSLVVSDQGLGPETGDHTDFIVVTR